MATQQSATVYITNSTGGNAWIQLYHKNSSNGEQVGRWYVQPGQSGGPLTVNFETGIGSYGIEDYWWVNVEVVDGPNPGQYVSGGSLLDPGWKECQLQHEDAGQTLTFSVSNTTFNINEDSGACSNGMNYIGPYSPITNMFVLMLENHSFDNIFAFSGINGIISANTGDSNSYNGVVYNMVEGAPLSMPTDPGHEFLDVVEQLGGQGAGYPSGGPYPSINNSGFAANYATTTTEGPTPPAADIGDIMACYNTQNQLPVMYQLATQFVICDQWFSSMPGPTWPNRFFVHGASSSGLDHSPTTAEMTEWETVDGFTYPHGSIYDAMNSAGISWRLYNDNTDAYSDDPQNGSIGGAIPQVSSLKGVTLLDINSLTHFASDLQAPYPYKYTFIEPNYGDVTSGTYEGGSSEHPMDDVYGAEGLIQAVYEAIRNSPIWATSMLVITYDEHGGFYDLVAPGGVEAPNDGSSGSLNEYGFNFVQLGVRVPAIIISPLVTPGTVDHTVYDHSSVLATLEALFGLGALTSRDASANNFIHLLTQPAASMESPISLNGPNEAMKVEKTKMTPEELAANDLEPVPEQGNLPGFLHIMAKTEIEMSGGTPAEKEAIIQKVRAIRTRGEARAYISEVMAKVRAIKGDK